MKQYLLLFFTSLLLSLSHAQNFPAALSGDQRIKRLSDRKNMEKNSWLANIPCRNIGPTIMSGRVVDIDVNPDDPTEFYVAYASGGLWHTVNNGQSFSPLFDHEDAITIGDIAVDWKTRNIWIGTGEANSSRSSYAGTGIYLSSDSGKTWLYKGLPESHHIGRIVLHPAQPGTAWVAVLGHLYTANAERGVYKTTDFGATWKKVLFADDRSGAVDLANSPADPQVLYAAIWHRERTSWNFMESGSTSGIYKSTDGGEHWNLLTGTGSGFPMGNGVGRIGIALSAQNPSLIYAVLDNQDKKKEEDEKKDTTDLDVKMFKEITKEKFLQLNEKKLDKFLRSHEFPEKYTASVVKDLVRKDSVPSSAITDYLNDANNSLFDTPIIGAEIYKSEDAGKTWKKTHTSQLKNLFFTYGYYFGRILVSPLDDKHLVICGYLLAESKDGGATFTALDKDNTHADHHIAWIDSKKEGHMIIGNDGGLNITYDGGKNWFKANTPAVGQFYSVNVDMAKPYNVYGGLQDNGVWTGPSYESSNVAWLQEGSYPFRFIVGGDGMQVQVDTRDNATVYSGFQFGNYYRVNKNAPDEAKEIKPKNDLGSPNFRFNWQTPVCLSTHNQDILYFGSNHFHRSMNKGDDMKTLSADLTQHNQTGDVPYNTLTSISESPTRFGLIYAGTDDGLIWLSKDAGFSWDKISDPLPKNLWVSRVTASSVKESRVYCSLNGYRFDHFEPYVFTSEDYGATWKNISANLPPEPVNVVKEDPVNENILYVGTDNGIYISFNRGESYMPVGNNFPRVAVHDLVVHPRDPELIVGTLGRSIYILPLTELRTLNDSLTKKDLFVYDIPSQKVNKHWGKKPDEFSLPVSPSVTITYFSKASSRSTIRIKSEKNILLKTLNDTSEAGLNYLNYDLSIDSASVKLLEKEKSGKTGKVTMKRAENNAWYLPAGKYSVEITNASGQSASTKFEVVEKEEKPAGADPRPSEEEQEFNK